MFIAGQILKNFPNEHKFSQQNIIVSTNYAIAAAATAAAAAAAAAFFGIFYNKIQQIQLMVRLLINAVFKPFQNLRVQRSSMFVCTIMEILSYIRG